MVQITKENSNLKKIQKKIGNNAHIVFVKIPITSQLSKYEEFIPRLIAWLFPGIRAILGQTVLEGNYC